MGISMCILLIKMTSYQLFSFIVFTSLLFIFISPCFSMEYNGATIFPTAEHNEKVNLSLYYETLCPGCAGFISQDLGKVFEKGLISIVNLRLVPFGNAEIVEPNKTIECQHGEDECYFNTIHACAILAWPDQVKKHFDFIQCLENRTLKGPPISDKKEAWLTCCNDLKLSPNFIKDCYESGIGRKLELKYGDETMHLDPPLEYVPWVTVNSKSLLGSENFVKYVCEAYKGDHIPEACRSLPKPAKISAADIEIFSTSVCFADEARH